MKDENLIEIVENYLIKNNKSYIATSIKYKGLRKDMKQIDGSIKSMYVVSFMSKINDNQYDSNAFYFVHIDAQTNKLDYILGPQSFEKINE
ncbi:hypothetical protein ACWKWW_09405 [Chryseobacterium cucumeris]